MMKSKIVISNLILDLQTSYMSKVDYHKFYLNLLIILNILKIQAGHQQRLILVLLIHFHRLLRAIVQQNQDGISIHKVLIKPNGRN